MSQGDQTNSRVDNAAMLIGPGGLKLRAIPYGATVTHLWVPDREGKVADVVLGFARDEEYHGPHPYFGVMAGRVAGRITNARFTLGNTTYGLAANDPPNHLHGGVHGFDKRLWQMQRLDDHSVRFSLTSQEGEEGYPGTVQTRVVYALSPRGEFIVDVEATADQPTPVSLTHHSYFNLAGEGSGESTESHDLEIFSDEYAPTDARMGFLGRRDAVTEGNDFRRPRRLAEAIPHLFAHHGDLYFTRRDGAAVSLAARVTHQGSGRVMSVLTSDPCIQFYTGYGLDGALTGKSGVAYGRHAGLCLECEEYPDGVNTPGLGDIILRPGETLRQRTVYAFSVC
jgi:aldose 1-epimerase